MTIFKWIFSVCQSFRTACCSGGMKGIGKCAEVEFRRRQNLHALPVATVDRIKLFQPGWGKKNPFGDQISPVWGKKKPFGDQNSPVWGKKNPFGDQISPVWGKKNSFGDQINPFWGFLSLLRAGSHFDISISISRHTQTQ